MMQEGEFSKDIFGVEAGDELKRNFGSAAVWAKIAAVIGLITAAINIIAKIVTSDWGGMVGALVGGAVTVLTSVFLLRFANSIIKGVGDNEQHSFNDGLYNLSVYFKVIAVILIIAFVVMGIALIFVIAMVALK
jgi:hypothetical protein